eukprot:jgi/Chlat1/1667/Chrsp127S08675
MEDEDGAASTPPLDQQGEQDRDASASHPSQEAAHIKQLLDQDASRGMQIGDKYYILSNRWYMQWKRYTESAEYKPLEALKQPPPISNLDLLEPDFVDVDPPPAFIPLKEALVEDSDFAVLPQPVWQSLHSRYGGGPELMRSVIGVGAARRHKVVEIYPLELTILRSSEQPESRYYVSKQMTVGQLVGMLSRDLQVKEDNARLWDCYGDPYTLLAEHDKTLEEAGILGGQKVLLEEKEDEEEWKEEPASSDALDVSGLYDTPPSTSSSLTLAIAQSTDLGSFEMPSEGGVSKGGRGGKIGLQNLGNTCFMNSAVQCLAHTPQLVDYFLRDFTSEINRTNPLGMQGELAKAFGDLLRKLWSNSTSPAVPRHFKTILAQFAPQFSGYNQHDSQEFLAFLLDGLHEDLNRVKQKPYIEAKDSDGRPDEVVSAEAWQSYKIRNDSVIVDVWQGQYKSTLVCPSCSKRSITFDPFMYLSLPLPGVAVQKVLKVTIITSDGSALPMTYGISVPKQGKIRDLKDAIRSTVGASAQERVLIAEVYYSKIQRVYDNLSDAISSIHDDTNLVAYRLPATDAASKQEVLFLYHHKGEGSEGAVFSCPLAVSVPANATGAVLASAVVQALRPLAQDKAEEGTATSDEQDLMEVADGTASSNGPLLQPVANSDAKQPQPNGHVEAVVDSCMETADGKTAAVCRPYVLHHTNQQASTLGESPSPDSTLPSVAPIAPMLGGFLSRPTGLSLKYRFFAIHWDSTQGAYDLDSMTTPAAHSSVDLVEAQTSLFSIGARKRRSSPPVSLDACIKLFLTEEPLGPDDMWYCPTCKQHRQATKKLDLWKLPEVLVVHLKRFSDGRWSRNKLETVVDFPVHDLDLTAYAAGPQEAPPVYNLFAVSNHYGGLGGGHYTAYAKHPDDGRWYSFDDSSCSLASESDVHSSAAYVLFYQRKVPPLHRPPPS